MSRLASALQVVSHFSDVEGVRFDSSSSGDVGKNGTLDRHLTLFRRYVAADEIGHVALDEQGQKELN